MKSRAGGIFRKKKATVPDAPLTQDEESDHQDDWGNAFANVADLLPDEEAPRQRPSYRESDPAPVSEEEDEEDDVDDGDVFEMPEEHVNRTPEPAQAPSSASVHSNLTQSTLKSKHIESSAGTHRLKRILSKKADSRSAFVGDTAEEETRHSRSNASAALNTSTHTTVAVAPKGVRLQNPRNLTEVMDYTARVVLPPLKVHPSSIGGAYLDTYPANMGQECLLCFPITSFECSDTEPPVTLAALQDPQAYPQHKRSLGLYGLLGGAANKGRHHSKLKYVFIARSTNRPLVSSKKKRLIPSEPTTAATSTANSAENDYDRMFEGEGDDWMKTNTSASDDGAVNDSMETGKTTEKAGKVLQDEEVSSFPVLVCMTIYSDGTAPDIRKLIPLDQLTTVQDLHSTVVQLAFHHGDTIRLDFGGGDNTDVAAGAMDKDRFLWSLFQIHAMLCVSVAERSSLAGSNRRSTTAPASSPRPDRLFLPPLNVRNLDRAELQYVATVNGFLRMSPVLAALLDRHQQMFQEEGKADEEVTSESMAYQLIMGNFATRVSLFQSDEERKDAEEVLNSEEVTAGLKEANEEAATLSVAERLGYLLQSRMRDLEAETCRRLIAWEDEKHLSSEEETKTAFSASDARDTVDALALASLFKTLESLDSELLSMEQFLQERAAVIKPLTDDCADIEEENRQLEQQWKSYDMLGAEMRRLLQGLDIDEGMEKVLKNPASALVYDEEGLVDVDESEPGIENIYDAGKALHEAIEYPRRSGGTHLTAVSERAGGLFAIASNFCEALAQIIVTVMEQFKTEVVAGSDYGKVSKSDTHSMIVKKIRDTQRKFQSALLGYIKLIEILAALSPDMLPALRDAYAEMVAEGILMKKRCKGYFQALPGRNMAYLSRAGKDLKDYSPFDERLPDTVNAPDIRAALTELLPVIAREAYFVSALFGITTKEQQEGREKKRNFENARAAVDYASQNFRYYIERTCGILTDESGNMIADAQSKSDPMLCLVGSIYLNEAMDNYIDREKKGGDHSLSLAYVRATILDLRKKADKIWISWVESQVEWIRSHDGVPLTGKRAGVFPSFARFPCYIDHILQCCEENRDPGYTPQIGTIKVVNYYLQKMAAALLESVKECSTRETTDKAYAADVIVMENCYFFGQAMKARGPLVSDLFSKQIVKANAMCKESTDIYLGWMIKREFTGLHDLFSKISKVRQEQGDREVATQVPRSQFLKVIHKEAERHILKDKIASMYSRMEKHLSEESGLLPVAWKALVKVLYEWFGRWEKLSTTIYRHQLQPNAMEIVKIAKAAGGAARAAVQAQGTEFGFKSILALGQKDKPRPSI